MNLGVAMIENGNNELGILELKRAARLSPYNSEVYYKIAVHAEKAQDWTSAAEAYEHYLKYAVGCTNREEIELRISMLKKKAKSDLLSDDEMIDKAIVKPPNLLNSIKDIFHK